MLINNTQSQNQQSEQDNMQHETQDNSVIDEVYQDIKSNENAIDMNYEDFNL